MSTATGTNVKNVLHLMDATGDTRIEWDPNVADEVEMARKQFKAAQKKRYLIYRTSRNGERGEIMREFDPAAERIVCAPQTVGG